MCFYAYKNVLEPMGHLGANLIFFILTLNQVRRFALRARCAVRVRDSTVASGRVASRGPRRGGVSSGAHLHNFNYVRLRSCFVPASSARLRPWAAGCRFSETTLRGSNTRPRGPIHDRIHRPPRPRQNGDT